jgi:hypothetical protein
MSTETLWGRLELGYAFMRFDMRDLPAEIEAATAAARIAVRVQALYETVRARSPVSV